MTPYTKTFEEDVVERLTRIEEHSAVNKAIGVDHESRLRSMERKQWLLTGAAVALGPLLSKLGIHLPTLS